MAPAVFLDRDGVLNQPLVVDGKPFAPVRVEDFQLYPEGEEACRLLKEHGFLLVVATNQPEVGRGTLSATVVEEMHRLLLAKLPIDRVDACFDAGDRPSFDRKPQPGMLLRAAEALSIDLAASFMVGDRWRDIDCGHAAGCRTIFVDRGYSENLRQSPNHTVGDVLAAAKLIVSLTSA